MTTLLENCSISPPPGTATELTLPLTFFDMPWLLFHPIRRILFYESPCSKSHFSDTLVPNLKQSLSITLKHYLPLSGNLLYPSSPEQKPKLRYLEGDSVSLSVVESTKDFDFLMANHARDADEFYDFVPQPLIKDEADYKIVPVLALQVTLFPGRGVCIGFANHHSVGDASSIVGFIRTWALINKLGGDEAYLVEKIGSLPLFDKSVIKDPLGIDSIYWNVMKNIPFKPPSFPLPTGRVRATYVLKQDNVQKLKDLVLSKNPELVHLSTFVVATAYLWTCFVKSGEEEVEDDELFIFAVDCRARIDPPVPANYFGNCLSYGMAEIGHRKLVSDEGLVLAATAIAENIKNKVNNKDEILKGAENWLSDWGRFIGTRVIGISGSPKFDLYSADFGWGKARKLEVVSIDGEKYAMSLSKCRDSHDGVLEVGFSLPKERIERFSAIFNDGLKF